LADLFGSGNPPSPEDSRSEFRNPQ
jgi:hypothetical protein